MNLKRAVFIRQNSLGYNVTDKKSVMVCSETDLTGVEFTLKTGNKVLFKGKAEASRGSENTPFSYNHICDFTEFKEVGEFTLWIEEISSEPLIIGAESRYKALFYSVMTFFQSQRCGDTNPAMHSPCHLHDKDGPVDFSGGWHDAGDYVKYVITVGFTAIEMLTAAEYALLYSSVPSEITDRILEEAKIGLDWLLKMTSDYKNGNYYYQAAGEEDHKIWRLPEEDDKTGIVDIQKTKGKNHRSLHKGWGENLLGKTAGALAMAGRLYKESDPEYASLCLTRAEALFSKRKKEGRIQNSEPWHWYEEKSWKDDMVHGAAELYLTTGGHIYKEYAENMVLTLTGNGCGWYGSEFLCYASCFRAGIHKKEMQHRMKKNLDQLKQNYMEEVFGLASRYNWGTCAIFLAEAQKALMYTDITGDKSYLDMALCQRDYLLGRNNWGLSFVVGHGDNHPLKAHSQINDLGTLHRGAVVGGPIQKKHWVRAMKQWGLDYKEIQESCTFKEFQSSVVYYDHKEDFICNEVAIDYAVPFLFLLIYCCREKSHEPA